MDGDGHLGDSEVDVAVARLGAPTGVINTANTKLSVVSNSDSTGLSRVYVCARSLAMSPADTNFNFTICTDKLPGSMNFLKFLIYYANIQKKLTEKKEEDTKSTSGSDPAVNFFGFIILIALVLSFNLILLNCIQFADQSKPDMTNDWGNIQLLNGENVLWRS